MTSDTTVDLPQFARPSISQDFKFFYDGIDQGRLLIQKCSGCGRLRNPPAPMCPYCNSLEWGTVKSSCRGIIHSYTVHYHPPIPPFSTPHAVVLADMEEGFRFLAGCRDIPVDDIQIGLPVEVGFVEVEKDYILPVFRRREG